MIPQVSNPFIAKLDPMFAASAELSPYLVTNADVCNENLEVSPLIRFVHGSEKSSFGSPQGKNSIRVDDNVSSVDHCRGAWRSDISTLIHRSFELHIPLEASRPEGTSIDMT